MSSKKISSAQNQSEQNQKELNTVFDFVAHPLGFFCHGADFPDCLGGNVGY